MSNSVYRRCGCTEPDPNRPGKRKQYTANHPCPKMAEDPKHGTWCYGFNYGSEPDPKQPGKTRRRQFRKAGFKTKRAAESAAAKLRASLDAGSYTEPSKKTLAPYAVEVIERRRTGGLKPTTLANYERYVRQHIVPSQLGQMLLTDIRRSHVNAFLAELTKTGRGAVTVRRVLAVLRMVFSTAVRDEIIGSNPAFMADKPGVSDSHVEAWEPADIAEFLQRCGRHRLGALFEVTIDTGLRRGEVCGLHWSDVNLAARTIVVRHNRVSVDGRVQESTTKTRSGRRTVSLSDFGVAALLSWQLHQVEEAENAAEAWVGDGHVFTMEDGRPLDPNYVTRLFNKIRQEGEPLPELTFHGLRHCAASLLLASGSDIAVVSKLLGHSSISVTADIYAHMLKGVGQRAVDGAAALIPRKTAHTLHSQEGVNT
jgi:integrase